MGFYRSAPRSRFERLSDCLNMPDADEIDPDRFMPSSRSVAFRRPVFEQVGGYPEWLPVGEDMWLNHQMVAAGARRRFAPDAIVRWRLQPDLRSFARQYYGYAGGRHGRDVPAATPYASRPTARPWPHCSLPAAVRPCSSYRVWSGWPGCAPPIAGPGTDSAQGAGRGRAGHPRADRGDGRGQDGGLAVRPPPPSRPGVTMAAPSPDRRRVRGRRPFSDRGPDDRVGWRHRVDQLPSAVDPTRCRRTTGGSSALSSRGPQVPLCTWTPAEESQRHPRPLGVQHGTGVKAAKRLEEGGLTVDPGGGSWATHRRAAWSWAFPTTTTRRGAAVAAPGRRGPVSGGRQRQVGRPGLPI